MERWLVALVTFAALAALAVPLVDAASAGGARPAGPPGAFAGARVVAGGPAAPKDAVEWALLTSYEYQPALPGLPDAIKALEGKTVAVRGYLLPIAEWDDIHEFCVVPNHMSCCFGMPAGVNGQVQVSLKASERGLPNTNEPIEVRGTFRAVETKDQGILLSIWRLDAATATIVGN